LENEISKIQNEIDQNSIKVVENSKSGNLDKSIINKIPEHTNNIKSKKKNIAKLDKVINEDAAKVEESRNIIKKIDEEDKRISKDGRNIDILFSLESSS
jgi:uncharacterized phage infection (PIP) family protein YhgE